MIIAATEKGERKTMCKITIVFGQQLTVDEFDKLGEFIDDHITEDYFMTYEGGAVLIGKE